jgi:hypothetical protein
MLFPRKRWETLGNVGERWETFGNVGIFFTDLQKFSETLINIRDDLNTAICVHLYGGGAIYHL